MKTDDEFKAESMYTYMHVSICIHVHECTHMCACVQVWIYIYVSVCREAYIHWVFFSSGFFFSYYGENCVIFSLQLFLVWQIILMDFLTLIQPYSPGKRKSYLDMMYCFLMCCGLFMLIFYLGFFALIFIRNVDL